MSTPLTRNYFELFGVPQRYAVDAAELAGRYRELQSQLHPDRYASAGASERRIAAQHAALVNEAYQTLKDPQRRAQYLLNLAGTSGGVGEKDTTSDAQFLMRQMELREALAEAAAGGEPYAGLVQLEQELREESARLEQEFEGAYSAGDLPAARDTVQKMQFFRRLLEDVAQRLEALDKD